MEETAAMQTTPTMETSGAGQAVSPQAANPAASPQKGGQAAPAQKAPAGPSASFSQPKPEKAQPGKEGTAGETGHPKTDRQWRAFRQKNEQLVKERTQRQLDEFFKKRFGGIKNPETGRPIESQKDYEEALDAARRRSAERRQRQAEARGQTFEPLLQANPVIRQAQQIAQKAQQAKLEEFAQSQFAALNAAHGLHVHSGEELLALPNGAVVSRLWQAGVPLADAYTAANLQKVTERQQAAARQAAINAVKGKEHLARQAGVSFSEVDIPPETLASFRQLLPNKSPQELVALYKKYR